MLLASIWQEQDAKRADTHYDICHFVTDSINLAFPWSQVSVPIAMLPV